MKRTLTCFFLIFFSSTGFSQSFKYGFGAELSYNNIVLTNSEIDLELKYKTGFRINAVVEYNISDKKGLRVEPGFARRGAILCFPGASDTKININYISMPILFKYALSDKLSMLLGPECAFKLSAKSISDEHTADLESFDSKFDLGIHTGILYKPYDKLEIGFRYNRGFISTVSRLRFTDFSGSDKDQPNLCNQGFAVSLAFMIN